MKGLTCSLLTVLSLAIGLSPVLAQSQYQEQIYRARDRVLPALIHIQPVVIDYMTGREKKHPVVGSGVILSTDGYAVTNYHVAGKAERIICTLSDREQVPAKLVGGDPATDIAVIKLDLSEYKGKITPVVLGNSDSLDVGQSVLAMGSPLALSRSVSMGVISTVNRFFPGDIRLPSGEKTGQYNNWLQTDAAINPGNSGGPLVNLDGEVIGINTRGVFFAENIGFSIPINVVKEVTRTLIAYGKVDRSWVGVHAQPLQDMESFFGADANRGVLIASVDPGSPAEEAGLAAGDIILKYDGHDVSARFEEEVPAFYQMIASSPVNQKVDLTILAGGKEEHRIVTPRLMGDLEGRDFDFERWGFTARSITTQMAIDYRLTDTVGVFVTQARMPGPAFTADLQRGDVIKKVDKQPINDLDQLMQIYQAMGNENKILLTVHRRGDIRFVLIKCNGGEQKEGEHE
ncbi:MAG: trypsin-like peptidase domain-containing protein [candidate division Zixibacteria bacterium]|nr:trypsin-like peptidase domain-containing protein [candidate division Zixibacteria bacterium]